MRFNFHRWLFLGDCIPFAKRGNESTSRIIHRSHRGTPRGIEDNAQTETGGFQIPMNLHRRANDGSSSLIFVLCVHPCPQWISLQILAVNRIDRVWLGIALALLLSPLAVSALEKDSKEPIYVDSDTATYDDQKGIAIYTGNVHSVQGSMVTDSNQMTVYLNQGKIEKIYATGNPVHIVQTPENGKGTIDAKSLKAEYYPSQYRLILIGKAVVLQSGNTYSSDRIEYDTRNSVAVAGEKTSASKRVHTVIGPQSPEASAPAAHPKR